MTFRDRVAAIAADPTLTEDKLRAALHAALADCLDENDTTAFSGYTPDVQAILRGQADAEASRREMWAAWTHSTRDPETGQVIHYAGDVPMADTPSSFFFGLTYASWLCLPRMSLQEMPVPWQAEFFRMINEADEKHGLVSPDGVFVQRTVGGKFVKMDHWNNYRYGNTQRARQIDGEI
uniref:Tail tubular protein A n=1 Tax=Caulobacter phage BL57 TaxID=3348355 RepID=A0AB74UIE8_9VIRU